MRFERIQVDSFGRIHDRRIEPSPGLTLVRGANEAGKTTLLAFLRAILFGFETNRYTGGGTKRGGAISVATAGGERFRIVRHGARGGAGELQVIDEASGADRPGLLAERLLAGMDRTVFTNIHAFGLDELASLQNLHSEALMGRIYSAAEGTGQVSAIDVEGRLTRAIDALWLPDGSRPELNALLAELRRVDAELATRNLPAEHATLTASLEETRAAIDAAEAELGRMRRLDELGRAIDPWLRITTARKDLQELDEVPAVAPDAVDRVSALETRVEGAERALEAARSVREDLVARRAAIVVDDAIRAHRTEVAELTAIVRDDAVRNGRRDGVERSIAQAGEAFRSALADLGPGWDAARLDAFDASVAVEAAIDDRFRDRMERSVRAVESAEIAARQADAELDTVRARAGTAVDGPAANATAARMRAIAPAALGIAGAIALLAVGAPPLAAGVAVVLGVLMSLLVARAERAAAAVGAGERMEIRTAVDRAEVASRTLDAARADAAAIQAEWVAWLTGHGLPADLGRASAAGLIVKARAATLALVQLRAAEADRAELDAARDRAFERARALATLTGVPCDPAAGRDAVAIAAAEAERRLADADRADERAREADARIADADRALEQAASALAGARTALAEHLAANKAVDPADLRRLDALQKRAREIQAEGRAARQELVAIRGEAAREALEAELLGYNDLGVLRGEVADAAARQPELTARRNALLQEQGDLAGRIAQLERSSDRSVLQQRREDLLARAAALADRWVVQALARDMLADARREYEDAHRPAVIEAAERHLARITRGRYHRILSPNGREFSALRGSDDRQTPLGELSLGTAQQLYLALRFGLIEHLGSQREPLPVVMDDILVNFDEERAALAAREIEELATHTQVIYFTCHASVALRADLTIDLEPLGPPPAA